MFIAKTYPSEESIQEHTDKLLENLEILRSTCGDRLDINWDMLELACIAHDLGKVNRGFQNRLKGKKLSGDMEDIPHGYLSILFLDCKEIKKRYGLKNREVSVLVNVVAFHHKRERLNTAMKKRILAYEDRLREDARDFTYDKFEKLGGDISVMSLNFVNEDPLSELLLPYSNIYIIQKGLLNKIDYAASGGYRVEYENDFLLDSLEEYRKRCWNGGDYNALQKYMLENQDENIIAIAETGYGKTEAGLLWIGDNKGFFTLPLKSAINQNYKRITEEIVRDRIDERVGLLHSDGLAEYMANNNDSLDEGLLDYKDITDGLSMPLTICTIDQIFDFVYKYVGFERKLATLAYSKVVIDEIQMYSPDLVAYIIIALAKITEFGGSFSIITATFPPFIESLLEREGIGFKMPEPYLKEDRIRHSIKIIEDRLDGEDILRHYDNNKVLVIVNTLRELDRLYEEIKEKRPDVRVELFHSGFIKKDRREKENNIVDFGSRENKESGIWISTQVAEASLDIDFDLLLTELSDLSGLFQRMGRCYRNRTLDKDYNIYIYDGGDKTTSGVNVFIDKDIFRLSKEELRKRGDGPLGEAEKIDLINRVYSLENIGETDYYKEIVDTIDYINSVRYEEFKKSDVTKYFRNINSIDIVPAKVYEDNKDYIDQLLAILKDKNISYIERKEARVRLDEYKLSIAYRNYNRDMAEELEINTYESLRILDCEYSKDRGIVYKKNEGEEMDNIF